MPYLPPQSTEDTNFPEAFGKDLRTQIRMIDEQYKRMFPLIDYYQIRKAVTPAANANQIVGEATNTKFDPMWGESVDPTMANWTQPHLSNPVLQTQAVEVFDPPIQINARCQRDGLEKELKKYGFDQVRDLIVFIPLSLLDANGITCNAGDKFRWDDHEYTVKQVERVGYWKNTNVRLYILLNCDHLRPGS